STAGRDAVDAVRRMRRRAGIAVIRRDQDVVRTLHLALAVDVVAVRIEQVNKAHVALLPGDLVVSVRDAEASARDWTAIVRRDQVPVTEACPRTRGRADVRSAAPQCLIERGFETIGAGG